MALDTKKLTLPTTVSSYIVQKAQDTSTIARLSPSTPQLFANSETLIFNGNAEAEVVGEGQQKSSYEQTLTSVAATRFKVQTTTRVTSELMWADQDNQLEIIKAIQADQAAAMGRALDYIVYHALNPKSQQQIDSYASQALSATANQLTAKGDAAGDVEALFDAVNQRYDVNGLALSRKLTSSLRKIRIPATGMRLFPDISLNLANAGNIDGVPTAVSNTVEGARAATPTKVLAFAGDFSMIKWGMVRDLVASVIPYGDPDQSGVDLAAHNQVAYRTEAVYGVAVIDPSAFAVLKEK